MITKEQCEQMDLADPLAPLRDQFVIAPGTIYLDGNSLGLSTYATQQRVADTAATQWAVDGIKSWNTADWINLPVTVGNKIAALIGATKGTTICCDSISVNLFKLICLAKQAKPERFKIISTTDNFGTDLYIVQGLQQLLDQGELQLVTVDESELAQHIDSDTLLVMATQVNFRTGNLLDVASLTASAHSKGAMMLVDLAHSAGALPVHLDQCNVDFAVGCTYKFLNGGPGAPGFAYVNANHLGKLAQPIYGWMGHSAPFDFSPEYTPSNSIKQLLTGTPPILSMAAIDAALDVFDGLDMHSIRMKSMALGNLLIAQIEQLGLLGELTLASPRDAEQRGSQVSFYHEHAYGLCQALIERGVIADFRAPNILRIGLTPLYLRYIDIANTAHHIAECLSNDEHLDCRWQTKNAVT